MNVRHVIEPNSIVPYFINISIEGQRLCDIVQVPLCDVNPKEIAAQMVAELHLPPLFGPSIESFIDTQTLDFMALTQQTPCTEWAQRGSAVHLIQLEAGLNNVVYSDLIVWDIFDEDQDADAFARITVSELCLPVEFTNVISAQIRWETIRYRAMHCYPERFAEATARQPDLLPQTTIGLRSTLDLVDSSPAVGLIPGANAKREKASRDRSSRYWRRQGQSVSSEALLPSSDLPPCQVKLVPIVRARSCPEDSALINLAKIGDYIDDPELLTPDLIEKVRKKTEQLPLLFIGQHQGSGDQSEDGSDSE